MSYMSPRVFLIYSFQWRIPRVILRYIAHLDSSNKLFFILKKSIEKTALVTQNHKVTPFLKKSRILVF